MATLAHPQSRSIAALEGIKVIDADTHLSEPYDLWTSRAPAKYRDRVPRVKKSGDGTMLWTIDDDKSLGINFAVSAVHRDGRKAIGTEFFGWQQDDVAPGSYDTRERLYMPRSSIRMYSASVGSSPSRSTPNCAR